MFLVSHKPDSKTIKSFTHSPEIISSILMIQPSTNLNLIHANCGCHFNEIDDLARAANILSEADVMLNEWRVTNAYILFAKKRLLSLILPITYVR